MFDIFNNKKLKELEERVDLLEKQNNQLKFLLEQNIENKFRQYDDIFKKLSVAIKGNYDLVKNLIDISSNH